MGRWGMVLLLFLSFQAPVVAKTILVTVHEEVPSAGQKSVIPARSFLVEALLSFGFDQGHVVTDLVLGEVASKDITTRVTREMDEAGAQIAIHLEMVWKPGENGNFILERLDWFLLKQNKSGTVVRGTWDQVFEAPKMNPQEKLRDLSQKIQGILSSEL